MHTNHALEAMLWTYELAPGSTLFLVRSRTLDDSFHAVSIAGTGDFSLIQRASDNVTPASDINNNNTNRPAFLGGLNYASYFFYHKWSDLYEAECPLPLYGCH